MREQALTKLESGGWTKISEAFDKLEKIIKNKFSLYQTPQLLAQTRR
jgi:hypothetical protein